MLTPSSDEDQGFLSPLPIPKSFLPSQQQFLNVDNSSSTTSVRAKKSKKLPTLEELTDSLRRQNPEKYNSTLPSLATPSQSTTLVQESTSTSTQQESDTTSTRRRASISLANALVRRQSTDATSSSTVPVGVSLSRRGSGVPTLASLGERLLDKRALDKSKKSESEVESGTKDESKEEDESKEKEGTARNSKLVEEKIENPTLVPSDAFPLVPTSDEEPSITRLNKLKNHLQPTTAKVSSSHPLQHSWTFYFQQNSSTSATTSTTSNSIPYQYSSVSELRIISKVSTLENFGPLFNHLKRPSQLASNASIYLFKNDIKPDIEKIENKEGGKFVLRIKGDPDGILIDRCWTWLVLALVGESIEDDDDFISGAVISIKPTLSNPRSPSLSLWLSTSSINDLTSINSIGTKVLNLLELNDPKMDEQIQFDFIPHSTTSPSSSNSSATLKIQKTLSPFMSVNTYKKLSSGNSTGSSWKLDRANSGGNKGGIMGGVLGNVVGSKNLGSTENNVGG